MNTAAHSRSDSRHRRDRIAIALRSSADSSVKPGDVNEARVTSDAATGNNWMVNGRTNDSKHSARSSRLTIRMPAIWALHGIWITTAQWALSPSRSLSTAYLRQRSALQGLRRGSITGKLFWKYDPQIRLDQALNGSYSARTMEAWPSGMEKFMWAQATAA